MARKQVAILSINRGVTTLNGLVVEPDPGEDPHQAGIRAVTEQIAAPSRKKVQVVATDDVERIRMYVHPDGRVTDIETLEVFEPPASPEQEPGAGWAPVPPRQAEPEEAMAYDAGEGAREEEPEDVEPAEPVGDGVTEDAPDDVPERERTAERPAVRAPLAAPVEEDPVPEREQTAERPAVRAPLARPGERSGEAPGDTGDASGGVVPPYVPAPAGEPQPLGAEPPEEPDHILDEDAEPEPDETPTAVVAPAAPGYDEPEPAPERLPVPRASGGAYPPPRSRVTTRGRVVLVVAAVILLILLYSAVRAVVARTTGGPDHSARHGGTGATAGASSSSAAPSPPGTVSATTLEPSPTPTHTAAPKPTHSPRPAPTRTLRVTAISETEAIKLVITASRLPVTATIRMDPWGAPAPFTRTVRLTEPDQAVMVEPVASGHAKWSVSVAGARKVTGYTHSWPKGKRTYVKR